MEEILFLDCREGTSNPKHTLLPGGAMPATGNQLREQTWVTFLGRPLELTRINRPQPQIPSWRDPSAGVSVPLCTLGSVQIHRLQESFCSLDGKKINKFRRNRGRQ